MLEVAQLFYVLPPPGQDGGHRPLLAHETRERRFLLGHGCAEVGEAARLLGELATALRLTAAEALVDRIGVAGESLEGLFDGCDAGLDGAAVNLCRRVSAVICRKERVRHRNKLETNSLRTLSPIHLEDACHETLRELQTALLFQALVELVLESFKRRRLSMHLSF
jgi:hypothetical protein